MSDSTPPIDHRTAARPPGLSVIVAAYNIAAFIDACLDSILASGAADIEVLVIDDGSTDTTPKRIASHAHDSRVHIIRQANGGLGAARNTGLDHARGRYILFVDGDDWLARGAISICLAAMASAPDADLFVFDYVDIRADEAIARRCGSGFWESRNAAWNKVYAQELIGDTRFDTDILYEDLACVRPWVDRARRPVHIPRALYYYRNDRPGSIMNARRVSRFFDLFVAAERAVARITEFASSETTPAQRLGRDWQRRLYTVDVFVPGIIYWTARIADADERRAYIRDFLARMPRTDAPDIARLAREFGPKIALIALCYQRGAYRSGDFLLHRLGAYRRALWARLMPHSGDHS